MAFLLKLLKFIFISFVLLIVIIVAGEKISLSAEVSVFSWLILSIITFLYIFRAKNGEPSLLSRYLAWSKKQRKKYQTIKKLDKEFKEKQKHNAFLKEKSIPKDSRELILQANQDNDGFITLWQGSPITLTYAMPAGIEFKRAVYRWAMNERGYEKLFYKNQNGEIIFDDVDDIKTEIKYNGVKYELLDEVFEKVLGEKCFEKIDERRMELYEAFSEIRQEEWEKEHAEFERREKSKRILYKCTPFDVSFSIFGDYFDKTKPNNSMKYSMRFIGLFGYPDTGEIIALVGEDEKGQEVQIRLNAIRTLITVGTDKYKKENFVEFVKTLS